MKRRGMTDIMSFDPSATITVNFTSGRPPIMLRFPPDEEWLLRARSITIVTTDTGRGKLHQEFIRSRDVDQGIVHRLIEEGGPVSGADASCALDHLAATGKIEARKFNADAYRISMEPLGIPTFHDLKRPSQADRTAYQDLCAAVRTATERGRVTRSHADFGPAGALYDWLKLGCTGYLGEPPIVHKMSVITELLRVIGED